MGENATLFVKNENKLNQMLSGGQILQSLALLAKVELVKQNITGDSEAVKRKFSFADKVNKVSHDEYTRSNDTERLYRKDHEIFADKLCASANADAVITATTSWGNDGKQRHPRKDNYVDFAHGDVLIQAGDNQ